MGDCGASLVIIAIIVGVILSWINPEWVTGERRKLTADELRDWIADDEKALISLADNNQKMDWVKNKKWALRDSIRRHTAELEKLQRKP